MQILAPFEATKISATNVGDLIQIAHSQSPLGLVVHEFEGQRVIGVLRDTENRAPYHIVYERDFPCFRFQAGWVLDLPRERARYPTQDLASAPGVIHIGKRGPLLNLAALESQQNALTVNLTTFEWDDVDRYDAAFPTWQIWQSEDDRRRASATPIFEFKSTL